MKNDPHNDNIHHHHHHHSHLKTGTVNDKNLILTMLLNLLITAAEIAGGLLAGSLSLVSDALHNLSDAAAVAISLMALRFSRRGQPWKKPSVFSGWRFWLPCLILPY